MKHLPKFAYHSSTSSPSSAQSNSSTEEDKDASSEAELEIKMPARGVKSGWDASKARYKKEERLRRREEARDARLEDIHNGLRDISAAVKRRNKAEILSQALKVITDAAQK